MSIPLLCHFELDPGFPAQFQAAGYDLHYALTSKARAELDPKLAAETRAVLTVGSIGLSAQQIASMPNLKLSAPRASGSS